MTFLPKDYKEPDTSNYMRLVQGENTFRVLSDTIRGYEYWKEVDKGREPVRLHEKDPVPMDDLEVDKDGNKVMPKFFWAFVVWNRNSERVQILELTQSTIRRQITALYNNEKWGDPKEYDITISKEGEKLQTEYTVMPNPKEKIDGGIVQFYKDMKVNLDALYTNDNPFSETLKDEVDPDDIPEDLGEK